MSIRTITVVDDDESSHSTILVATRWGSREVEVSQESDTYAQLIGLLNSLYVLEVTP